TEGAAATGSRGGGLYDRLFSSQPTKTTQRRGHERRKRRAVMLAAHGAGACKHGGDPAIHFGADGAAKKLPLSHDYFSSTALLRAASNSSPGFHVGMSSACAISHAAYNPRPASSIMPSKFQLSSSLSPG